MRLNLGRKISIFFSLIAIGMVLVVALVFYHVVSWNVSELHYRYLEDKAQLIAIEKFEYEEMDSLKYQNLQRSRQNTVPTSKELILNISDKKTKKQLCEYLTEEQFEELLSDSIVDFIYNGEDGVALLYYDVKGTYSILVIGPNHYAKAIGRIVGWSLAVLVVIFSVILYFFAHLYAVRSLNEVEKAYRTERLFVNNASHEINNPLTAIQGECDIALMRDREPEEYRNSLQRISEDVERMINIINQLLNLSSTSEATPEEELEKVDMEALVKEITADYDNISVSVNENFTVLAKYYLLQMAIRNIINNARKYSDDELVSVVVDNPMVKVSDLGIGIPPSEIEHIFDPFYRASNSSGNAGNGIGLALAKTIIEKSNAEITVHSDLGKGTTFCLKFKKV